MSEMNNRLTYDFAAALRGEELKEVERSAPGPDRPSYDFAAMLRQSEELVPSRPTAEETVEAATPPARERGWPRELSISAEGMKLALKSYLSTWLNRTKVSFLTELGVGAGAGFLANMAFTELVAKSPEAAKLLPLVLTETQIIGGTMAGLVEAGALGVLADRNKLEIAGKYARALSLAERIAVTKSADGLIDKSLLGFASLTKAARDILTRPATAGFTAGTWLYAALAGAGVFGDAVIPAAAGGGEGLADPGSVDGSIGGQVGGLSSEDGSVGAVIQPPAEIGGTGAQPAPEVVPGAGVLPAEDLLPQPGDAEAIARQAAEAARQAALDTAATTVGITGQELDGGTIWGNELEFVKQLGIHHVEPVTNLLKNFSKVLAQAQPPTEIGPTDTAYVINRDVAGWAAGQADILYGMDPSSMTSWQKALWEIGRGLREANWRDLQAVTEEFVRQAKP